MARFELTSGNWITIGVFVIGIISAWAKIQVHISDDAIHLTEKQRDNLIRFTTIVDEKLPKVESNNEELITISKEFAVFKSEFEFLYEEHSDLEEKVSRIYKELNEKINNNHE